MEPIIHGWLLAFGLILPLGVQNVFIFNQGATQIKFVNALPAVITAAVCDTLLILLAVGGLSIIVFKYEMLEMVLYIIGFLFLAYMGWGIWKSTPNASTNQKGMRLSMRRQIIFAASVSLLNPHAIMDTIGVIGTSSLTYIGYEKYVFTVTCVMVSWIWFFSLAFIGRKVGQIDSNAKILKVINQISAILIWVMSIFMGYQLYRLIT